MGKKVISVLGPISPDKMGITDAHNHLWISPLDVGAENAPVLDKIELIQQELVIYKKAGGESQIDCQPGGAGRDGNQLRELSKNSGVNVVACTGFHLSDYYPREATFWKLNSEQALDYFLDEIENGLVETRDKVQPVFPGFIKIAARETINQSPIYLIEAAVEASIKSGLAIEMHTEKGAAVEEFLKLFQSMDLPLNRLVICHIDKRPDLGFHQELAQAGCALEYDTFFRPKYKPEKNLWSLVVNMVKAGYQESIMLATDLADCLLWQTIGNGPGLAGFVTEVKERLEEVIVDQYIVNGLIGGNIAACLAVNNKE